MYLPSSPPPPPLSIIHSSYSIIQMPSIAGLLECLPSMHGFSFWCCINLTWKGTLVTSALFGSGEEDHKFKIDLCYTASLRAAWTAHGPVS